MVFRKKTRVASSRKKIYKWNLKMLCNIIIEILENKFDCFIIIEGRRGLGKCQIAGDKVLMSNGSWKNIENIKVGDKVISPNNKNNIAKVINVHKRFEKEVYEVREVTRDKKVLYTCAGNHDIPLVKNKIQTAKQIAEKEKWKIKNSHICSFTTPIINFDNQKNSKIEPYSLGVFLGDGSFSSIRKQRTDGKYKGNWLGRSLDITTADFEIIEEISKHYPIMNIYGKEEDKAKMYRFSLNGEFAKQLMRLGLEGKRSGEKFIPKECLLSDVDYRLKLLAGIIDTDGYVMKKRDNHIEVTTKSKQFAEDIKSLVFSLGGYSKVKKIKKKSQTSKLKDYYDVSVSFEKPEIIPLLTWKKQRLGKKMTHNPRHIAIECVKTKPQMVYGFEVDSKSKLYITNNFMVTHNSTLGYHILRRVSSYIKKREDIENKEYLFRPKRDILFTQNDVLDAINKRWHDSFLCDEMINVTFNRDFFSDKQKKIIKAINMNRDHRNLIVACVPQFATLDHQIKNLCRLRITVVKRGISIIHTPNKTIYSKDVWDSPLNEKIERQWLGTSVRPKYSRLTTFRGFLSFPDLKHTQRELYEKIKVDKRNLILNEEQEVKEQKEGVSNPTNVIMKMLKDGLFKSKRDFDKACLSLDFKPTSMESRIRRRLRNEGKPNALRPFFTGEVRAEEIKAGVPNVLSSVNA